MNKVANLIILLATVSCSVCRELQNSLLDITFPLQQEVIAVDSSENHEEILVIPTIIAEEEDALFIANPNEWIPAIIIEESLFVEEYGKTILSASLSNVILVNIEVILEEENIILVPIVTTPPNNGSTNSGTVTTPPPNNGSVNTGAVVAPVVVTNPPPATTTSNNNDTSDTDDDDGPLDRAKDDLKDAKDTVKDAVKDAAHDVKDAVKDALCFWC